MAQLTLQEAIQRAYEILTELYPEQELSDVLLEEIERGPASTWNVTLGFRRPTPLGGIGTMTIGEPRNRLYKRIRIDARTGEFKGMTDRRLEEVGP
jgi:hypothetical protein